MQIVCDTLGAHMSGGRWPLSIFCGVMRRPELLIRCSQSIAWCVCSSGLQSSSASL